MGESSLLEHEGTAEDHTRRVAIEALSRHCHEFAAELRPGGERLFLVKATKGDGERIEAVIKLVDQFETVQLEITPVDLARSCPDGEVAVFVLPHDGPDSVTADSHRDVALQALEDAVFLTGDLRTPRSKVVTDERREVTELPPARYQQLVRHR